MINHPTPVLIREGLGRAGLHITNEQWNFAMEYANALMLKQEHDQRAAAADRLRALADTITEGSA